MLFAGSWVSRRAAYFASGRRSVQCECAALLRGVRLGCAASADEMALPCTPESTAGMLACRQVVQTSRHLPARLPGLYCGSNAPYATRCNVQRGAAIWPQVMRKPAAVKSALAAGQRAYHGVELAGLPACPLAAPVMSQTLPGLGTCYAMHPSSCSHGSLQPGPCAPAASLAGADKAFGLSHTHATRQDRAAGPQGLTNAHMCA